jgi:spore germination protein GerM
MTRKRAALTAGFTAAAAVLAWVLFAGLPRWYAASGTAPAAPATAPAEPGRKITARLFYVSNDGRKLTSVEREVPFAETVVEQARALIDEQLAPVVDPLVSAIPPGARLRALFVTERGEAFVDLSPEITASHPGGSLYELLTVYTIVHALTMNLPAITSVQLLVEGKEVDTLAGHVDLRSPIMKNPTWIE